MMIKFLNLPALKKSISANNIADENFINNIQNSSLGSPISMYNSHRQKSSSWKTQDMISMMDNLYNGRDNDASNNGSPNSERNSYHIDLRSNSIQEDNLPTELSPEWISVYFKEHKKYNKTEIQLSTIHEFLSTELNFLNQLQYILDVSSKVVTPLQQQFLKSVRVEELFLNVGEIYEANYQFWSNYLYPSYREAVENKTKVNISQWKEGFQQMSVTFAPYQSYCARIPSCQKYIQNMEKSNKYFNKFSQWFSSTKAANRESLTDFIAKPFQRLTKYELLLSTTLKYSDESDPAIEDLREMIQLVSQFMKMAQRNIGISGISIRLEPIDFVDSPSEEAERQLCAPLRVIDLTQPINMGMTSLQRDFISLNHFKMKESNQYKAIDVTCYLFTDMLLICQRIKNTDVDPIKLIRPIVPIKRVFVKDNGAGQLYLRVLTEFGMLAAMYLFTGVSDKIECWMNEILRLQTHLSTLSTHLTASLPSTASSQLLSLPAYTQSSNHQTLTTPHLQVTSPSPLPGRSPSPEPRTKISLGQLLPQDSTVGMNIQTPLNNGRSNVCSSDIILQRNHPSNSSFMRSSLFSSPMVRKRNTSENESFTKSLPRHPNSREPVTYKKSYSISSPNDNGARILTGYSSQSTMNLCTTNETLLEEEDCYLDDNIKDSADNRSSISTSSTYELNELGQLDEEVDESTRNDNVTDSKEKESVGVSALTLVDGLSGLNNERQTNRMFSANQMTRMKRKYQSMNSLALESQCYQTEDR